MGAAVYVVVFVCVCVGGVSGLMRLGFRATSALSA